MSKHRWKVLMAFIAALLFAGATRAEDKDPFAVVELGGAGEWGLNGARSSFGPSASVEFAPIKNWLVIETGVTTLFSRGQTEWDTDFMFKKPFDLSPTVEFEPGIGPVWMHTVGGIGRTDSIGAEAVLDGTAKPVKGTDILRQDVTEFWFNRFTITTAWDPSLAS